MLRPSRPALLPQHRFQLHNAAWRAGTAQTLQAAQGQARGRGQAGWFWDCPKPESEVTEQVETIAQQVTTNNDKVAAVAEMVEGNTADITSLSEIIKKLQGDTQNIKHGQVQLEVMQMNIKNILERNFPDVNLDTTQLGDVHRDVHAHRSRYTKHTPDATVDENPGDGNTDATGDGKLHTISAKKYSLRCSRAGPTSKPRHSGYGDLRV